MILPPFLFPGSHLIKHGRMQKLAGENLKVAWVDFSTLS
jgi:hypothetical protein